jgi:hypothetical protein
LAFALPHGFLDLIFWWVFYHKSQKNNFYGLLSV